MAAALLGAALPCLVAPVVDPRHAPLLSWLSQSGAELGPVTLGKSRAGAGYGAYASRAVAEDELLFSIPSSACVTLYDACGDEEVGEALARLVVKGQGGATVALAAHLAKEWLCEADRGPRGPYLAMLPWDAAWPPEGEQEQEHVLWWSEAQVDKLEGSAAFDDAVGIRDEVAVAAKVIRSLIGAAVRKAYKARGEPMWNVWKADDDIDRATRGAFVSLLTRSFTQEDSGDEEKRLVPLLDMLQHADVATANVRHVQVDDESSGGQRVVVTARRPLEAGEELLNCCARAAPSHFAPRRPWPPAPQRRARRFADDGGELDDAKFLSRFGFVPGKEVGEFVDSISDGKLKLPFGLRVG